MNLGDMTVGSDPEDLFICPYDKTHVIRRKILPYHLIKCRKNFTGNDYKICPFNANHEVPAPEFNGHQLMCEDRYVIAQNLCHKREKMKPSAVPPPPPVPEPQMPTPTEDWEQEIRMESRMKSWRREWPIFRGGAVGGRLSGETFNSLDYSFNRTREPRAPVTTLPPQPPPPPRNEISSDLSMLEGTMEATLDRSSSLNQSGLSYAAGAFRRPVTPLGRGVLLPAAEYMRPGRGQVGNHASPPSQPPDSRLAEMSARRSEAFSPNMPSMGRGSSYRNSSFGNGAGRF